MSDIYIIPLLLPDLTLANAVQLSVLKHAVQQHLYAYFHQPFLPNLQLLETPVRPKYHDTQNK